MIALTILMNLLPADPFEGGFEWQVQVENCVDSTFSLKKFIKIYGGRCVSTFWDEIMLGRKFVTI
jgi:hypothetical protein